MGCSSTKVAEEKNEQKVQKESNTQKESPQIFRQEEISFINEQKEKLEEDIKNGTEEGGDIIYPIYRKIVLDLTEKLYKLKEYLVFYIPSEYSQSTATYDETPPINQIKENIDLKDLKNNKHYCKVNGSEKSVINFEFEENQENQENQENKDNAYIRNVEFEISQEDKEKKLVTMETGYNIKLSNKIYVHILYFDYSCEYPPRCTYSFILDDNYAVFHPNTEDFQEITKYTFYSFNFEDDDGISLKLKDKRNKINIENELDKKLLSNFSQEEIKQINISLNTIEYYNNQRHLIYQKVVHNIKEDGQDFIKIYDIIYFPHRQGHASYYRDYPTIKPQEIIVKRFKVNNLLVPKKETYGYDEEIMEKYQVSELEEDPNEEGYEPYEKGFYISSHKILGFFPDFDGYFALYEFDCVSNERLDYLPFDCNYIGIIEKSVVYGESYKYEVILNGHNVKFSNENLDYSVKNGRIVIQGMIDGCKENYDKKKYVELALKQKQYTFIEEKDEDTRMNNWAKLRRQEVIPKTMKIV